MESINNERTYAVCSVAAAPVRKEPSHRSEMVNQLVWGEQIEVLEAQEEWRNIRSLYDGYEGWVTFHLINEEAGNIATSKDVFFTLDLFTKMAINKHESFYLPMGSFLKKENAAYDNVAHWQSKCTGADIIETARKWLHVPYMWGGKTAMGVDCSGFVQTVFKVHGIVLKRDAFQQAGQGVEVSLEEAGTGDVAFFNNDAGRITHVGILLSNEKIIHAAGKVRIDAIDNNGIQNEALKKQTHNFHSVRRMIS